MISKATLIKQILACSLSVSLIFSLAGCNKALIADVSNSSQTESEDTSPNIIEEDKGSYNIYTGEWGLSNDRAGKRPVAIMLNNIKASLPQKGISQADVVYEMPVEGGYTRLMAVFSDCTKADTYGSVRSARHDFVEMADSLNAVFVHWGGSDAAYSSIKNNSVTHIDGMAYGTIYFYTDKALNATRSIEHCRFTTGSDIKYAITKLKISEDNSGADELFNFNKDAAPISYPDTATNVSAKFSGDVTATFTYDTASGKYIKGEYGENQIDGNTNEAIKVSNVFLLYAGVSYLSDNVHKDVDLSGGSGYYITNGTYTPITWSKGSSNQTLKLYDQNGNELTVNTGNSWVMFVPKSMSTSTFIG